jgi:hypothetical protein
MKLQKNIAISESGFLFNPGNGDSFSLNDIGLDVLTLLQKDKNRQEIVSFVTSKYEVDASDFEKDLEDFRMQLRDAQLLIHEG